jgi:phospholipid/cholesterol/gamma-HCH transport system substrate-binding protein
MEKDAKYVAVGAFILLVLAMGVGFVLWYTDASDGSTFARYEIQFAGSVNGLDRGSPVRYLGVDVGRVRRLSIDLQNPTRVNVLVEVDDTTPISSATRASLGLQGVTGLLYINLYQASDVEKTAALRPGEKYPIIESVVSDFDSFLASLPELMGRANSLLERVGRVLSDRNLEALSGTLASLRETTATFPATSRNAALLVEELQATVKEIHTSAETLNAMTTEARPEVKQALERVTQMTDNLAQASLRVDRFMQQSEQQLGHFTQNGLFEIERLVRETRSAAREFRDLSRSLQENPSQILYEPPESGVEIAP